MGFIYEKVAEKDWEFFNSLNIQFEGKHITADRYTRWVREKEKKIYYTKVKWGGRDYGDTCILIWGEYRIYIYMENKVVIHTEDKIERFHCDIRDIRTPRSLESCWEEVLELIKEILTVEYYGDPRNLLNAPDNKTLFVIDGIADPTFVEEVC
jgi:hypothetical protein